MSFPTPTLLGRLRNQAFSVLPPSLHWPLHAFKYYFFTPASEKAHWDQRISLIRNSPDSNTIHRAPDAGDVRNGIQTLHNGLRVVAGSYFGIPGTRMLRETRGIHEPQEEKAFAEVVAAMPPSATMVELGAYWAYYSAWFAKGVADARCYLLEPDRRNLRMGERNFALNALHGSFFNFSSGASSSHTPGTVPVISVDDFMRQQNLARIDLLHSDIQGWEEEMLKGAREALQRRAISYVFISTHSEALHRSCTEILVAAGYQIMCSVSLAQSYSVDGLLVAKAPDAPGPGRIEVSLRPAE